MRMLSFAAVRPAVLAGAVIAVLAFALNVGGSTAAPAAPRLEMKAVPDAKVGRVDGTRAYIAASFDGKRLRVYVCDGTKRSKATLSEWFKARWDGRTPLTLTKNGIELRLDPVLPDGRITGSLTAFSGPHAFTVSPATGPAGLYDGKDSQTRSTWIVQSDGSVRGAMACPRPP